jgi:hypothetical protein
MIEHVFERVKRARPVAALRVGHQTTAGTSW